MWNTTLYILIKIKNFNGDYDIYILEGWYIYRICIKFSIFLTFIVCYLSWLLRYLRDKEGWWNLLFNPSPCLFKNMGPVTFKRHKFISEQRLAGFFRQINTLWRKCHNVTIIVYVYVNKTTSCVHTIIFCKYSFWKTFVFHWTSTVYFIVGGK